LHRLKTPHIRTVSTVKRPQAKRIDYLGLLTIICGIPVKCKFPYNIIPLSCNMLTDNMHLRTGFIRGASVA
jgi:hypothetical protein